MTECSSTARCAPRLWAARLCSASCKRRSCGATDTDKSLAEMDVLSHDDPHVPTTGSYGHPRALLLLEWKFQLMHDADSILTSIFGLEQFRLQQREIVNDVLAGRDALVVMPTGAGKSLCYQLPAVALRGLTLIVSPLISLMTDQVRQLRALRIPAMMLCSGQSWDEQREVMAKIARRIPRTALRGAGEVQRAGISFHHHRAQAVAAGHRRGALHQPVGTRFPSRVSASGRGAQAAGRSADHCADGDGDARGARRHRAQPGAEQIPPSTLPASTAPTSAISRLCLPRRRTRTQS